jgi:hypothetical protein
MVFHFHREMLDRRVTRRPLWHRPTVQHATHLQAQVEVTAAGVVQVYDKPTADRGARMARARRGGRLRRVFEMALAPVSRKPFR